MEEGYSILQTIIHDPITRISNEYTSTQMFPLRGLKRNVIRCYMYSDLCSGLKFILCYWYPKDCIQTNETSIIESETGYKI